ncbi:MAG: methyltransferase domain-containing protein [Chitinivibrionales bacterium]|nr:methyltransferase domain-containing protein [Chitinivibrionales bacterium]
MTHGRGRHPARHRVERPSTDMCDFYLLQWFGGDLYRNPEQFPKISSAQLFGNTHPLELEIGCATGEYIVSHATARPLVNFIGVDCSQKPLFKAIHRSHSAGALNIRFIRNDILLLLPLFESHSLQRVYFHFPIPITTRQQKKHTIFTSTFLDTMALLLTREGIMSIMTDDADYCREMESIASRDARFHLEKNLQKCEAIDPKERSYYHRFWQTRNKQEQRFLLMKNGQ